MVLKTTFVTNDLKAAVTPLKQHDIGDKGEFFFDMISSTGWDLAYNFNFFMINCH